MSQTTDFNKGLPVIKLVLSDIDNTLVPLGERFASHRSINAIHDVIAAGVSFGPATGRDYFELLRFFHMDEACFMTGIISNGKRVRVDGEYVYQRLIPHEALVRIDEVVHLMPGVFLVCYPADSNMLNPAYGVGVTSEELAIYESRTSFNGSTVDEVPNVDVIAATLACSGSAERARSVIQAVEEAVPEVELVSPFANWIDILPRGTSKATSLDVLLEHLGIGIDEVVVFGDGGNDVAILDKVHYSVAVANAVDVAKEAANFQVGAAADEGVAEALEEIARATRAGEMPAFLSKEDQ